jgi:hypothetical protein
MRFCPFCSAENPVEATHCATCARRLPPVPPRRQKSQAAAPRRRPTSVPAPEAQAGAGDARALRTGLVPAPTALRRLPQPAEERPAGAAARRRNDVPATAAARAPSTQPIDDTATMSLVPGDLMPETDDDPIAEPPAPAPARRAKTASVPPPLPAAARAGSPGPAPAPDLSQVLRSFDGRAGSVATGVTPPAARPGSSDGPLTPQPPRLPPTPSSPIPSAARPVRDHTVLDPPPTRIGRADALADRPFTPPQVLPVPEVPEPGLINAARYAVIFARARWQRRGAIKLLGEEIKQETSALDQVLGALGRAARTAKVEGRAFASENGAITAAEERRIRLEQENADLSSRRDDENTRFAEIERDRLAKQSDAERLLSDHQRDLASFEGQRRGLRDKRKDLERRQRAYLKAAEDRDAEAGNAALGDARSMLRRQAEDHRREAAALEPERQEIDRRLAALERPLSDAQARVDAARAEVDAARRSVSDAREGHNHRLAELEAEQKRKMREVSLADAEIQRRMVTLGTLVNLNRVERDDFNELYDRIDRLRGAIAARTTEIDKLTAEREAYDKGSLVRGAVAIGAGVVGLVTLIVILLALV